MSRLLAAQRALTVPGWVKEELSRKAQAIPSLDLQFANSKSLQDSATGANLVTFTRASSGTFVGSDGVLRTAVTNLLLRSEEFDNASWSKNDGPTVTANQIAAPNGTLTADQMVGNGSATGYLEQAVSIVSGLAYTFSVYMKKRNTSTVSTLLYGSQFNSGGGNPVATWNLDTGNASFTNGATGSMISVGDGWYRCVMTDTATTTNASSLNQWVRLVGNSGDAYLWGAQLEQSATVGEYIPTTSTINSAPRFDHNPTTGESLGLLVEEQRTNLLTYSDDFSNAAWTSLAATLSSNAATAPDSALTADSYTATAVSGEHRILRASNATVTASSTITFSVFVKASGITRLRLNIYDSPSRTKEIVANVNLSTGTINTPTAAGGYTAVASSIQAYSNSFYRISITGTVDAATTSVLCDLGLQNSAGNGNWTPAGTEALIVWGAQLEAGAFPTSYIPTTTTALTRSADVASITGANFSSWYRQDEGTVYHQGRTPTAANFFSIDDATANNRITSYMTSATAPFLFVATGGAAQVNLTSSAITAGSTFAQANVYKAADFAIVTNGGTASTSSSGSVPIVNRMIIGANVGGSAVVNGTIRRLTYWPQRLPNSTLQTLTQ